MTLKQIIMSQTLRFYFGLKPVILKKDYTEA